MTDTAAAIILARREAAARRRAYALLAAVDKVPDLDAMGTGIRDAFTANA